MPPSPAAVPFKPTSHPFLVGGRCVLPVASQKAPAPFTPVSTVAHSSWVMEHRPCVCFSTWHMRPFVRWFIRQPGVRSKI